MAEHPTHADAETVNAYDIGAAAFADDWETQAVPIDLYEIMRRYFHKGLTADIGCGSGRDSAWLNANGFAVRGYDASDALLKEARMRHPGIIFEKSSLPALAEIADGTFHNVLCETVIMHLPVALIPAAVRRLVSILNSGGFLCLSWRVTNLADKRDDKCRLYVAFDPALVISNLQDAEIVCDGERVSTSSGKTVHRIIAQRR
jgi:2-polyprenyl-3-methyl-5-hydroxy-6-metoxy-1,4-benzoquinol methylase